MTQQPPPPGYEAVWREKQNQEMRSLLAMQLVMGVTITLVLQPGDATRYRFLLSPESKQYELSDDDRLPRMLEADGESLLVTVLDGLGNGVASIMPQNGIEGIRHRIAAGMEIRNPCTAEALAHSVYALWSHLYVPLGLTPTDPQLDAMIRSDQGDSYHAHFPDGTSRALGYTAEAYVEKKELRGAALIAYKAWEKSYASE